MSNEEILNYLKNIDIRLQKIESDIELIKKSCNHMDNHINFVDNVYDNVKKPLFSVLNTITGYSNKLEIENYKK